MLCFISTAETLTVLTSCGPMIETLKYHHMKYNDIENKDHVHFFEVFFKFFKQEL